MSTLIVEVCEVKEVRNHPHADRLEIVVLKGWPVVVQKSLNLKVGDKVVYFPPDSVLSEELGNKLGILKYLQPVFGIGFDGKKFIDGYRVRAAVLRGEASYGTIEVGIPSGFNLGDSLTDYFGVKKYEPLPKAMDGEAVENPHPLFFHYTNIENIRNFPNIFQSGEEVIFTEKLHGKNMRVALLKNDDQYIYAAGSHDLQRKEVTEKGDRSDFWLPLSDPNMKALLEDLSDGKHNVIVYGELIGSGVQDMAYGYLNGSKDYRAFDIRVGDKYLDHDDKMRWFEKHSIPTVPLLYRGPFSWEVMESFTSGETTMCEADKAGKFKGREGIVITPIRERLDFDLPGEHKRVIMKSVSADYIARKGGTEDH